jgi:hypothetical protein
MGPFLLFAEAQDHARRGSVTTGRALAQELVQAYPSHELAPRAWHLIAESWSKTGRVDSARAAYETVMRQFPTGEQAPVALYKLGHLALREADTAQAISTWERVVARHHETDEAELAEDALQALRRAATAIRSTMAPTVPATIVLPPSLPAPGAPRANDSGPVSAALPSLHIGANAGPPPAILTPLRPTPLDAAPPVLRDSTADRAAPTKTPRATPARPTATITPARKPSTARSRPATSKRTTKRTTKRNNTGSSRPKAPPVKRKG